MRRGWAAVMAAALWMWASSTSAYVVNVTGSGIDGVDGKWEFSTVRGPASELVDTLDDQFWWGNADLASSLAAQIKYELFEQGSRGAAFLVGSTPDGRYQGFRWGLDLGLRVVGFNLTDPNFTFAVASRVQAVPEPGSLTLGLGGLAAAWWTVRRRTRTTVA